MLQLYIPFYKNKCVNIHDYMEEVDIKAESGICTQSLGRNAQKETVCWLTNGLDQILHVGNNSDLLKMRKNLKLIFGS